MGRRWWLLPLLVIVVLAILVGRTLMSPARPASPPAAGPAGEQRHGIATATAPAQPIGVAARSDWYELYTTNPRYPDDPQSHRGGLDEKLVALMDRAQQTMDVADYDFDLAGVAAAMAKAKQRGVRVRLVTDSDTLENTREKAIQDALGQLKKAGIPVVDDRRAAIMHDKFTAVDGEWVSTGSWNYTDGDTYRLNNWMGIFHSKELAANYATEFGQMFEQRKLGPAKAKRTPNPTLTIGGARVSNCFSPQGDCADLIIDTIKREARQSIQFMAFSFTHDGIGKAIADRAKAGVKVVGVFETTGSQTPFSEYGKMKQAGLDVYADGNPSATQLPPGTRTPADPRLTPTTRGNIEVYLDGNPYAMHHKVIVIDGHISIAGSFNFSNNADQDNDENLLITDDQGIARFFQAEFERVLAMAKNPPQKK